MANICEVTGKRKLKGNRVSHANNKKIHFQQPNIRTRSFLIPELGRKITIRISTRGIKTITKSGSLSRYLISTDPSLLSERLAKIRKDIFKKGLKEHS